MTDTACQCKLCTHARQVGEVIASRDVDRLIDAVNELMNANYDMTGDLDYANAILDGSWPTAVQQLERALVKAKAKAALQPEGSGTVTAERRAVE